VRASAWTAAVAAAWMVFAALPAGGRSGGAAAGAPAAAVRRPAAARGGGWPTPVSRPDAGRRRAPAATLPFGPQPPQVATARALVVGVTFAGTQPTLPLAHFAPVFFGPGPDSVASYLRWASYGRFRLTGAVVGASAAGQAGDWLVVPHSLAYYARGQSGMGPNDSAASSGGDLLEQEVLKLLDAAHFNWTPYLDAHGDVPYLILLVDSPDASLTGRSDELWSYEESGSDNPIVLPSGRPSMVLNYDLDAAFAQDWNTPNGVGTFDHEFAHLLGALDMYDTNNSIAGLANWSLMGSGNYNGPNDDGSEPSDLDAFTRLQFGWSTPVPVTGPPRVYVLRPAETSPQVLEYAIPDSRQYYLMENRQPIGPDAWLPGRGLLIYRVDGAIMNPSTSAWNNDCLECVTGSGRNPHPGIEIMQADGSASLAQPGSAGDAGSASDPFPGTTGATQFSDATRPSAVGWGGVPSYLSVSGVTQEANGDILLAAGSVAASVSPDVVPTTGGTVTVTDALGPFAPGDAVALQGLTATAVTGVQVLGPRTLTFSLAPGTAPGVYLVSVTTPAGTSLPLAYLTVAAGGGSQAPTSLAIRALAPPRAGSPTPFAVRLVDRAGARVSGDYGTVWVNGVAHPLVNGAATVLLDATRAGAFTVSAVLDRLPSIVGSTTVQVAAGPPARVRITGPTAVRAGQTALYRVWATDRYGNPVTGTLSMGWAGSVRLVAGRGRWSVSFRRAGVAVLAPSGAPAAGSLRVRVAAAGPYSVTSRWTPAHPMVGEPVRITALARDAFGNPAEGWLTLAAMTRRLADGEAVFRIVFRTPGLHRLRYRVPARSQVAIDVRPRPLFGLWW
jgi:M6 family metalloprotease-like protein